jgi:HD-GYP domain-containing protein (c-di-GMP phosphodiesterase class II)/predicted negative regulator of RcsB-dependent stress response
MNVMKQPPAEHEQLAEQARAFHAAGDLTQAVSCFELALEIARLQADSLAEVDLLRLLGSVHRQAGDKQRALSCYEESLNKAEAAGHQGAVARALNCLGIVAQFRGDVDLAVEYYNRGRQIADSIGEHSVAAMIDQNLGTLASMRGRFDDAIVSYSSAHMRFRSLGNRQATASVLNNLGMLHTEKQQWADADLCLDDAFSIAHDLRDASLLGKIEVNRANLHMKQRAFEGARDCCDQAFEIFTRAGDRGGVGETYKMYGALFHAMDKPGLAQSHLERAVDIARSCEDRLAEAEALRHMALVHLGQDRNVDALTCLNGAHQLFQQLQSSTALSELDRHLDGLEETYLQVVETWAESIEAKDRYTAGHCGRVADYAVQLAAASGFEGRDLIWFRMGGFLHDVGKTGVPLEVLNKPGKLTEEEFLQMQSHTTIGDAIVAPLKFPWNIRPLVRSHHEKWDGTGYPDKLKGEEIPLAARILCVADVYDALTTARSYRPALSQAEAFKIMDRESGTTLDPELYARFRNLMQQPVPMKIMEITKQTQVAPQHAPVAPETSVRQPAAAASREHLRVIA